MEVKVIVFKNLPNYDKAEAVTTSMNVAEVFGKQHKNVLQDIRNLDCSEEFTRLNFQPSEYTDSTGRKLPMYTITRDGFTFLVMGYRGKKAAKFKEEYIKAFNRMEKELSSWRKTRGLAISIRKSLIDAIKNNLDTTKPFVYSNYTRMAVKKAFGKSIEEMRQIYGVNKECNLRDYLCPGDLARLDYMEGKIASMVDALKILGMSDKEIYSRIKNADIR